jgi:hypothetical protein
MKDNTTRFQIRVYNKDGKLIIKSKLLPIAEFDSTCNIIINEEDWIKIPTDNGWAIIRSVVIKESIFNFEFE